jgi:hypothetical protein
MANRKKVPRKKAEPDPIQIHRLRDYMGVEFWAIGQRILEANWPKSGAPILGLEEFLYHLDHEYSELRMHLAKKFKPKGQRVFR